LLAVGTPLGTQLVLDLVPSANFGLQAPNWRPTGALEGAPGALFAPNSCLSQFGASQVPSGPLRAPNCATAADWLQCAVCSTTGSTLQRVAEGAARPARALSAKNRVTFVRSFARKFITILLADGAHTEPSSSVHCKLYTLYDAYIVYSLRRAPQRASHRSQSGPSNQSSLTLIIIIFAPSGKFN